MKVDCIVPLVGGGALLSAMLFGCAAMGPPEGGPEDQTPPEVVSVVPPSGSLNVPAEASLRIVFSEPVDEGTLASALFLSPPQGKPKLRLRGRTVVIRPVAPIPADRPLLLTLGSGVKDLHGNPLKSSLTVALTAGDRIPGGNIVGRVYGETPCPRMLVGAWLMTDTTHIAPDEAPPHFLTQSGATGDFSLDYLPAGEYRVLAWDDRDGDRRYAPGVDRLALPPRDVTMNDDSTKAVNLFAVRRDTVGVAPLLLLAPDNRHLQLRLSKPPTGTLSHWLAALSIADSSGGTLAVQASWADPADSARLIFLTAEQPAGMRFQATLEGDTAIFTFAAGQSADSTAPRPVASYPPTGARDIPARPVGWIAFDDALSEVEFADLLSLTVSDSVPTPVEVSWQGPNIIGWQGLDPLVPGARCKLSFLLSGISDRAGNRGVDSTWSSTFSIADPALAGEIAGRVYGAAGRSVIVSSRKVAAAVSQSKGAVTAADGSYRIPGREPGNYTIWCWEERVHDGCYTPGTLAPFVFAEPFAVSSDTVEVRARWETGEIDLRLP